VCLGALWALWTTLSLLFAPHLRMPSKTKIRSGLCCPVSAEQALRARRFASAGTSR
jgi:hypothetical protein